MPNNPIVQKRVNNWTITIDRPLCIGAASCIAIAPKAYSLDGKAKAVILDTADQESPESILDSAKACPTAAIIIHDENGKQIYP